MHRSLFAVTIAALILPGQVLADVAAGDARLSYTKAYRLEAPSSPEDITKWKALADLLRPRNADANGVVTIQLVGLYDEGLVDATHPDYMGSALAMDAYYREAVEATNAALATSDAKARLELVGVEADVRRPAVWTMPTEESTRQRNALLQGMRNKYGADLVVNLQPQGWLNSVPGQERVCGSSLTMTLDNYYTQFGPRGEWEAQLGEFEVGARCISDRHSTFAHELGHSLGILHRTADLANRAGFLPYAAGGSCGANNTDLLAGEYESSRFMRFTNPVIQQDGQMCGDAATADGARVIREYSGPILAAVTAPVASKGQVTVTAAAQVNEGTEIVATVTRTGTTTDEARFSVAVANNAATWTSVRRHPNANNPANPPFDKADLAETGVREVVIPAGQTSAELRVRTADNSSNGDGAVRLYVRNAIGSGYKTGSDAVVTVKDNDPVSGGGTGGNTGGGTTTPPTPAPSSGGGGGGGSFGWMGFALAGLSLLRRKLR